MCGSKGGGGGHPPNSTFSDAMKRSRARQASNRRAWRSGSSQYVRDFIGHHVAQTRQDPLWPVKLLRVVPLIWRLDDHDPDCPYVLLVRRW